MALYFRDPVDPPKYCDMLDRIHLDEKWFFSPRRRRSLLLLEEKNPKRCIKHKSHITKVMFLCAIVCPRFNPSVNSWWDGKLEIWPIGDWEPGKCKSKIRLRGALVWKNKAVTKEVYREVLISKLLPAIIEKWPWTDRLSRKIYVQQDSAKSHMCEDNNEINNALAEQDINVELYTQVVNSPDVNLLDWGFFGPLKVSTMLHKTKKNSCIQLAQSMITILKERKIRTNGTIARCIGCGGGRDDVESIQHSCKQLQQ